MLNRIIPLGVILFGILLGGLCNAQDNEPFIGILESVEARVNEEVITTSEVDEFLQKVEFEQGRAFINQREYEMNRQRVVEKLIEEALMVQEARRRGWQIDKTDLETDVEKEWQRRVQVQGGPEAMQQFLNRIGVSEKKLKETIAYDIERDYLRSRVMRSVIGPDTGVTIEDIEQFRIKYSEQAQNLEAVQLSHILIAVPENATPEEEQKAKKSAEQLLTKIRALGSNSFEKIAREDSDHEATRDRGGSLGIVRRGELYEEFDVAFDMEVGEVSEPIRTPQGYHLLKVTGKRTIDELVYQQKVKIALDDLLNQLREDAVIVVKGSTIE